MLFTRKELREEWKPIPWQGVEVWSERARSKDVFTEAAKATIAVAKRAHVPVLVGVQKKAPVASDGSMWMCGIRVMWPAGTDGVACVNDGLVPFLNRQQHDVGDADVREKHYGDFADALSSANWGGCADAVWRINFDVKAKPPRRTAATWHTPNVDRLREKDDLPGLLRAIGHPDDQVRRSAMEAAVTVAIELQDDSAIMTCSRALAAQGAQGDEVAIETLVRILAQGFKDVGLRGYSGNMESRAYELLPTIGPQVVRFVSPLLDGEWLVAEQAAGVLGRAGDLSVLNRIVSLGLRQTDNANIDQSLRQACFTACLNLFTGDPDGFVELARVMGEKEREFLSGAASYAHDRDRAQEIYPEGSIAVSAKQKAAIDRAQQRREDKLRARRMMADAEARRKAEGTRPKLP